jgi:hypothetical protein
MYTEKLSEALAVVGAIDPDAYTAAAYLSDAVDMAKFNRILAIVMAGTLGTNATLDAELQWSDASGGTYATITGKTITQLTQAGSDDDKQAVLELSAEELNLIAGSTARFVKLEVTVGTATSDMGAVVLGAAARHKPAVNDDLASVDEIVS